MRRPREVSWSVEQFKPPFCPNDECEFHLHTGESDWPRQPRGFRLIDRAPGVVRETFRARPNENVKPYLHKFVR